MTFEQSSSTEGVPRYDRFDTVCLELGELQADALYQSSYENIRTLLNDEDERTVQERAEDVDLALLQSLAGLSEELVAMTDLSNEDKVKELVAELFDYYLVKGLEYTISSERIPIQSEGGECFYVTGVASPIKYAGIEFIDKNSLVLEEESVFQEKVCLTAMGDSGVRWSLPIVHVARIDEYYPNTPTRCGKEYHAFIKEHRSIGSSVLESLIRENQVHREWK